MIDKVVRLDAGWRFAKETSVKSEASQWQGQSAHLLVVVGKEIDESGVCWTKAGKCAEPTERDFDDSAWRQVSLPHDWSVEEPFAPTASPRDGFLPAGIGWYRHRLAPLTCARGKKIFLQFDGVFRNATVFVNGIYVGSNRSGYVGFECDISDAVDFDGDNVVAVRVDACCKEGWFYEGAGIYRHVYLRTCERLYVPQHGLTVVSRQEGDSAARTEIRCEVINDDDRLRDWRLRCQVLDAAGRAVASAESDGQTLPGRTSQAEMAAMLSDVRRWSLEDPHLYRLVCVLESDGQQLGRAETAFGVRTVRFDSQQGFFLNGQNVKLKGVCCHQDHAGVGSAIPDRLQVWRLERLKEMGCNAYRCSHNPPAPEVLDACDRLGIVVMDEVRVFGSSDEALSQARRMVRRDRNHPSVILWSLGNEEMALQETDMGQRIAATMIRNLRALDASRPFTFAMNWHWDRDGGVIEAVDVHGLNYLQLGDVDALHSRRPEVPLVLSEEVSNVCTRGAYSNDWRLGHLSAYDVHDQPDDLPSSCCWPGWGCTAESAWRRVAERQWLAGLFVWTGFDYRGEQTPFVTWPHVLSHFGIMDVCGFAKDSFYYYQAWWSRHRVLHLLPHWNWAQRKGQPIAVWCYSNAARVRLLLNGRDLGEQAMPRNGHLEWQVPYEPGELVAVGIWDDGQEKTAAVRTTGPAHAIRLSADRQVIDAGPDDCALVRVEVVDRDGLIVPGADHLISFGVTGPGRIIGVGNGDPVSHESDKASVRRVFHGLAQAIVQGCGASGSFTLTAQAPDLLGAQLEVRTQGGGLRMILPDEYG